MAEFIKSDMRELVDQVHGLDKAIGEHLELCRLLGLDPHNLKTIRGHLRAVFPLVIKYLKQTDYITVRPPNSQETGEDLAGPVF